MQSLPDLESHEYPEYFGRYVRLAPDADVLRALVAGGELTAEVLGGLDEARGAHAYAPGKWTVKSVLGHMSDTERVMAGRALHAARGTSVPLPGFDQDQWAEAAQCDARSLGELVAELAATRAATVALFRSLDADAAMRRVVADAGEFTARAFASVIVGHERHHLGILQDRYGIH